MDDGVQLPTGRRQPILVALPVGRSPPLDDACAFERRQAVREEAAGDPRHSPEELVEVSGAAEELADDERRPALGEELCSSRDRAELAISRHKRRLT
jgi:hypothetical protein